MTSISFDTLKFVETLESAGLDRKQASAIASAVRDSQAAANVATKADLELLRKDIIIKLGGMLIAGFGTVIAVLFKLLS